MTNLPLDLYRSHLGPVFDDPDNAVAGARSGAIIIVAGLFGFALFVSLLVWFA